MECCKCGCSTGTILVGTDRLCADCINAKVKWLNEYNRTLESAIESAIDGDCDDIDELAEQF